jgi:hypothetical protein
VTNEREVVKSEIDKAWADGSVMRRGKIWAVGTFADRSDIYWEAFRPGERIYVRFRGRAAVVAIVADGRWWRELFGFDRDDSRVADATDVLEAAGASLPADGFRYVTSPLTGDFVIGGHEATIKKTRWAFVACKSSAEVRNVIQIGGTVVVSGVMKKGQLTGGATGLVDALAPIKKAPFRVIPGFRALSLGGAPIARFSQPESVYGLSRGE